MKNLNVHRYITSDFYNTVNILVTRVTVCNLWMSVVGRALSVNNLKFLFSSWKLHDQLFSNMVWCFVKKIKYWQKFIFWLAKQIKLKRNIPPPKKPNNEDHKSNFLYVRFAKVNFYVVWCLYDALLKSCVFNIELFFFL